MPTQYQIAFWNLENLFDIEDSPRRTDKLKRALGDSVKGWTDDLLTRKLAQLASVIVRMNDGSGPDMLGVCEVENEHVMIRLVDNLAVTGRNYLIAHHDSPDQRGIDVGFIYDADRFTAGPVFDHVVMRRTATRAILQVNFATAKGRDLVLVGNHWPSRRGGVYESEGYRMIAGETLAYFHERILEVLGKDTAVLAMGDFNDEPFNRSIVEHGLALRSRTKVVNATSRPLFLDLMWPLMDQGVGTHFFDNFPNMLDQFLANKNLLKQNSLVHILPETVTIEREGLFDPAATYPAPIPFGGMGKKVNLDGFSDHFPISVRLVEAD